MATTAIKCNFTSVFAKYDNQADLSAVANSIVEQMKEAYAARLKEISSPSSDMVELEVCTSDPEPALAPSKKAEPKGKAAKAKEIAKKLKEGKEKAAQKVESKPKAEAKEKDCILSKSDIAEIKKLNLTFEKYNDRCWVLRGDTKPLRKILKEEFKGVFNSRLTGGEGWVIKTSNVEMCAKALGLKVKVA